MQIGRRNEIMEQALRLREKYSGDLYGMTENGGTSTIYVSDIPFADIDRALVNQVSGTKNGGKAVRLNHPQNMLEKQKGLALLSLFAPLVGVGAALGLAGRTKKEDEE